MIGRQAHLGRRHPPDVQEKCYKEIEDHIGESKVSLEDTGKLNFCQATIAEIQRVGEVAIASLQHIVTEEVVAGNLLTGFISGF